MKGVLLAAGKGTRMRPLTYRRPKALVPLLGRPLIEYMIEGGLRAGVDHWLAVIGHLGDQLRAGLGDGSRLGCRIEYIVQAVQDGNGSATALCEDFVAGEPFFLQYADIITGRGTYHRLVDAFGRGDWDIALTVNWVEDPYEGGAVYTEDGRVVRIVEKPPKGTATTHYNNSGLYVFRPAIFDLIRETPISERGEYELAQAVSRGIEGQRPTTFIEVEGFWSDVARPSEVLRLQPHLLRDGFGSDLVVAESARVSPQARLQPPVMIHDGATLGAAEVGPNVCVGAGVHVADGCRISEATLLRGSRVGPRCRLRGVVVEEDGVLAPATQVDAPPDQPQVLCPADPL